MATVKHPGKDAALSEGTKLEQPVNNDCNTTQSQVDNATAVNRWSPHLTVAPDLTEYW